jgi:hypothetical protein
MALRRHHGDFGTIENAAVVRRIRALLERDRDRIELDADDAGGVVAIAVRMSTPPPTPMTSTRGRSVSRYGPEHV